MTARAGEIVDDGYGLRFLVLPAGSFEIVEAPLGARVTAKKNHAVRVDPAGVRPSSS